MLAEHAEAASVAGREVRSGSASWLGATRLRLRPVMLRPSPQRWPDALLATAGGLRLVAANADRNPVGWEDALEDEAELLGLRATSRSLIARRAETTSSS
jgi:hypothetical protein